MRIRQGMMIGLIAASGSAKPSFDWVTVGDPGNRGVLASELLPQTPTPQMFVGRGKVNRAFRITRTEVTAAQWIDFVRAYAPYATFAEQVGGANGFWGPGIAFTGFGADGPTYALVPGEERLPTIASFNYGARFANWLHNGKGDSFASFQSGAYDMSTFYDPASGEDRPRPLPDQEHRSDGARFWIPSLDEWIKSVYYDPHRYGDNEGGYWNYPDSTDSPLSPGAPGEGETNAGTDLFLEVGSYPDVQSPWGLLDASGGVQEWVEDFGPTGITRYVRGSEFGSRDPARDDLLGYNDDSIPYLTPGAIGFRLATVVPAPASTALLTLGALAAARRRRYTTVFSSPTNFRAASATADSHSALFSPKA